MSLWKVIKRIEKIKKKYELTEMDIVYFVEFNEEEIKE